MNVGIGARNAIVAPGHISRHPGKPYHVSRTNGRPRRDIYPAEMPILRIQPAGMFDDDLIAICRAWVWLNVGDGPISGGNNRGANRSSDIYSGM